MSYTAFTASDGQPRPAKDPAAPIKLALVAGAIAAICLLACNVVPLLT